MFTITTEQPGNGHFVEISVCKHVQIICFIFSRMEPGMTS